MVIVVMGGQDEIQKDITIGIARHALEVVKHTLFIARAVVLCVGVIASPAAVDQGKMALAFQQDTIGIVGIEKVDAVRKASYERLVCDAITLFICIAQKHCNNIKEENTKHLALRYR